MNILEKAKLAASIFINASGFLLMTTGALAAVGYVDMINGVV